MEMMEGVHKLGGPRSSCVVQGFDHRADTGPFDIIGDVHGCAIELETLLTNLGYELDWSTHEGERTVGVKSPHGRKAILLGDLVDRGPNSPDVLRIAMSVVEAGVGFCIQGNHERKLARWLKGRRVTVSHGLQETIDQLEAQDRRFRSVLPAFLDSLCSYLWLDNGDLAVAHAGLRTEMIGRNSESVRRFAVYGQTNGETDEFGLPVRSDWAAQYDGRTVVIYGHTPIREPMWFNNTLCIDTGCVFGGSLTALRWPERELVHVKASKDWFAPQRPIQTG